MDSRLCALSFSTISVKVTFAKRLFSSGKTSSKNLALIQGYRVCILNPEILANSPNHRRDRRVPSPYDPTSPQCQCQELPHRQLNKERLCRLVITPATRYRNACR